MRCNKVPKNAEDRVIYGTYAGSGEGSACNLHAVATPQYPNSGSGGLGFNTAKHGAIRIDKMACTIFP